MRIIISPAKQMREDRDTLPPRGLPGFLPETGRLLTALRNLSPAELQKLWKCNDAIAALNVERLRTMDLEHSLTPALLSYVGIQYQTMGARVFETGQYEFLQEHLRILSGFYGLLRPFDGVVPYRREMGATKEYSRAVLPHLPPSVRVVSCVFGELRPDGKVVEKGTLCKMARGEMVRWLAETGATHPDGLPAFQGLGYRYDPDRSTRARMVFLKTSPSSSV